MEFSARSLPQLQGAASGSDERCSRTVRTVHSWQEVMTQADVNVPEERLLHQRFEQWAAGHPDHAALILGERRMSYGQLNRAANRLAWVLIEKGVGPETLVGICQERQFA